MADTKVKINFNEGTIELEGTESFVEKHCEEIKSFIQQPPKLEQLTAKKQRRTSSKKSGATAKEHKSISYAPIPVNLKGSSNTLSLKKFFEDKKPSGNQEIITVFTYYLNKYCKLSNTEMGHFVSCYNEVDERKPKNIYQVCSNTVARKGYLESGDVTYSYKTTIQGDNLIEHDLPHKTKSKK